MKIKIGNLEITAEECPDKIGLPGVRLALDLTENGRVIQIDLIMDVETADLFACMMTRLAEKSAESLKEDRRQNSFKRGNLT